MSTWRPVFVGGLMAALLLSPVTVSHAAAPTNDVAQGAVVITALPFATEQDTTEATTDAGDALLNQSCGAPVTDASVWYAYTPSTAGLVSVTTSQSDYSGGVLVAVGSSATSLTLVACGQGGTSISTTAGETYWFMAIDDQLDSDGRNGGTLRLQVQEQLDQPVDLGLTVDRFGTVDRQGVATITGTASCAGGNFLDLSANLTQDLGGRLATIQGFGYVFGPCEGTFPWSMLIYPFSGKFAGGKAANVSFAFSCNVFTCSGYQHEAVVQLRRNGR